MGWHKNSWKMMMCANMSINLGSAIANVPLINKPLLLLGFTEGKPKWVSEYIHPRGCCSPVVHSNLFYSFALKEVPWLFCMCVSFYLSSLNKKANVWKS